MVSMIRTNHCDSMAISVFVCEEEWEGRERGCLAGGHKEADACVWLTMETFPLPKGALLALN